ncbi:MAG: MgtC/SapB family protein [Clostridia bacterium]|nr:MgtC/SapB family protein [Clostridia bacterium]
MPNIAIYFSGHLTWGDILIRVAVATLVGILVGIEREIANHPAGMKTHALVCLGAAVTTMLSVEMSYSVMNTTLDAASKIDISRIASGVVSGIGFIGAGSIIRSKDGSVVTGITTAATVWVTGCMGLAIGMGYFKIITIALLAVVFATFLLRHIESRFIKIRRIRFIEVIMTDKKDTLPVIDDYLDRKQIIVTSFDITIAPEEKKEHGEDTKYCARYFLRVPRGVKFNIVMRDLAKMENVVEAYESSSTSFSSKKRTNPQT